MVGMNTHCEKCGQKYGIRRRCYRCEAELKWTPKPWLDSKSGYLKIRLPVSRRKVNLHRWLMEQHLGRTLEPSEVVHHINEDKTDNRICNLHILSRSTHIRHHKHGLDILEGRWSLIHSCCIVCHTTSRPHKGLGLCVLCYSRKHDKLRIRKPKLRE